MNKSIALITIFLLCAFGSSTVSADAPVWQVTKGDKTMYIGGTIHMLTPADYPLPAAFEAAYEESEIVVFETDISALNTPEVQQDIMTAVSYVDGQTLLDDIKPETLKLLEEYCAARGIPVAMLTNFKPGMVASVLTIMELQTLGLMGTGVDEFYNTKASNDKKVVEKLETVDEQIQFIADMGKGEEDQFIAYTIRDLGQLKTMFADLKSAWRAGDMQAMEEMAIQPMKTEFPGLFKLILTDRNNDWMPDIESMLKTPEVELVLVGALHLAGENGVLEQLRRKGYTVEKI